MRMDILKQKDDFTFKSSLYLAFVLSNPTGGCFATDATEISGKRHPSES
jgi:hypothetical protein